MQGVEWFLKKETLFTEIMLTIAATQNCARLETKKHECFQKQLTCVQYIHVCTHVYV